MSLPSHTRLDLAASNLARALWRACVCAAGHYELEWMDLTHDERLMWAQRAKVVIDFFPESQADPAKPPDDHYFEVAKTITRSYLQLVKE
jgi:hypothetical protein